MSHPDQYTGALTVAPPPGRWVVIVALADGTVQRHNFPWRFEADAAWVAWEAAVTFVRIATIDHEDWTVQAVIRERWSATLERYVPDASSFISPAVDDVHLESPTPGVFRKRPF